MTEVTINEAAKKILADNKTALIASATVLTGDATRKATAAQTMALTAFKAFKANGAVIPAADIAAYLSMNDAGLKKFKQYVSRAKKLYENDGATCQDSEGGQYTLVHDDIIGANPPSLTTVYKDFMRKFNADKDAAEAQAQARAMELKAAQAFINSGADMPDGVTNADELLAVARGDFIAGRESDYTAALDIGRDIVESDNIAAMENAACEDLLTQIKADIDKLYAMNSDSGNDTISTVYDYIESLAAQSVKEASIAA